MLGTHHSSGSAAQTCAALPEISSEATSSDVVKTAAAPPASCSSPILSARGPSEAWPLALVSVSTFADLPSTVENYARRILGPFATDDMISETQERAGEIADFPPDQVRPVDAIAKVTAPTLIVHGTADGWIPIANGEALIAASGAAQKRLVPIEGAGHGDIHRHSGDVWRVEVIEWLDEHLGAETTAAPVAAPAAPQ